MPAINCQYVVRPSYLTPFLLFICPRSYTARLGSRKWAPRFDYILEQQAFVAIDTKEPLDQEAFKAFLEHPVHAAMAACSAMRPSVDISVASDAEPSSTEGVGVGGARTEYRSTVAAA
jgi:ketol-acid reductoisomerase